MAKTKLLEKVVNKLGANGDEIIADPIAKNATLPNSKDQGEKTNPGHTTSELDQKTPSMGGNASADSNKATLNMKPSAASAANVTATVKQEDFTIEVAFEGEDLSEAFKEKASTIFEAAVNAKVQGITEDLQAEFQERLEESVTEFTTKLAEQVDEYVTYVAEQWMEANELAVESSLRSEITEEFIDGMKKLFVENYINVPDDKLDVLESLATRVEELEEKLNESINDNIELASTLKEYAKESILAQVAEGLTTTQKDKFMTMAEGVEFSDEKSYEKKLHVVKESFFNGVKLGVDILEEEVQHAIEDTTKDTPRMTPSVANYVTAISRSIKK
jgi:hypothetical protein